MKTPWYHKTSIYQIYPRSFYDSNNDGIGDLQGIIQKLDYIHNLGFESLWISPFFSSPQADFGYDVSNYTDIAPEYGTMEDATQLIEEAHKRGMKIVFDMVMNHTSIEHGWFKESRSSKNNAKADWYIWRDKPNNWQSMTGGSGWHYSPERRQYFWASFLPFQPDLNYRNPEVKKAMFDTVRFWLGKGVDGFRLDIFNVIYKDAEFRQNPFSFKLAPTEDDPSGFFQEAKYTLNQPESFAFAKELRAVCNEFGDRILLGEVSGNKSIIRKFLGDETNNGLGLVFDFEMLGFQFTAKYFHELIQKVEAHFPSPFMPVYVFSNHDRRRSIHKLGNDFRKAKLLALLQLTIRGVPCMYYGEEIGMTNLPQSFSTALDPIPHKFKNIPRFVFDTLGLTINRDEVRTPMQWDETKNAGFSSAQKTWLPIHDNYNEVNVARESQQGNSLLNAVRAIMKVRNNEATLREGSLHLIENLPKDVLGYERKLGSESIFVFLNFSEAKKEVQFKNPNILFQIAKQSDFNKDILQLGGFDGIILKPLV
ncbi:MAG: alpha-amylase family glycosyl hydrolase [Anaerolineales bacterium]